MTGRDPLVATGETHKYHLEKYIKPYLPGGPLHAKDTHVLRCFHEPLKAGSKITLKKHKMIDKRGHVIALCGKSRIEYVIPMTKILKPGVWKDNKGINYERQVTKFLSEQELMEEQKGAGYTNGNDFYFTNKRNKRYYGKATDEIQGEVKIDHKATFGQLSLNYTKEKGWHVSDKTKENKPYFAQAIENARVTIKNRTLPFLDAMSHPNVALRGDSTYTRSDTTSADPVHAYLKDHKVDVLHIGTHGTYRAGLSKSKDRTGVGFPVFKGEGSFRARQQDKNNINRRLAQFRVHKVEEKSDIDMMKTEDIEKIKRALGYDGRATTKGRTLNSRGRPTDHEWITWV